MLCSIVTESNVITWLWNFQRNIYVYIYNFKLLGLIFHGITFRGEGENGSDE